MKTNRILYTKILLFSVIFIDSLGCGLAWPLIGPLFMEPSAHSIMNQSAQPFVRGLLYGISIGIFPIFSFFCSPIIGNLSDRFGRKKILVLCMFGTGLGMLLCTLAINIHNVSFFVLGRIVLGATAGSMAIAQAAMIDLVNPIDIQKDKIKNLGIITLATNSGFVIGPMIGSLLIDNSIVKWFCMTTPFYFSTTIATANALMLIFTFRDARQTNKSEKSILKLNIFEGISLLIKAFSIVNMRSMLIVYLTMQLSWSLYFQYTVVRLVSFYHYTGSQVGRFISFYCLIFAIGSTYVIRIAKKSNKPAKKVCFLLFLIALSCTSILLTNSICTIWIASICVGLSISISYNAMMTIFSNSVTGDHQGWIMGVAASIGAMSFAFSAIFSGGSSGTNFAFPYLISGLCAFTASYYILRNNFSLTPCGDDRNK